MKERRKGTSPHGIGTMSRCYPGAHGPNRPLHQVRCDCGVFDPGAFLGNLKGNTMVKSRIAVVQTIYGQVAVEPGDCLICNINHEIIRKAKGVTSWAFPVYQVTKEYTLDRIV